MANVDIFLQAIPPPFSVGRIRVTPLVFDLSGDLEAGGQAFMAQLEKMLEGD